VWLTVGVALLLGYLLFVMIAGQMRSANAGATTLNYPASWVPVQTEGATFSASDRLNGGPFAPTVAVFEMPRTDLLRLEGGVQEAAANWTLRKQDDLVGYRVLSMTPIEGRDMLRIDSVYLKDPAVGASGVPALMRGIDVIRMAGDNFYILSYSVENSEYDSHRGQFDALLNGWQTP
jgi:hypothetical protein